MEIIKINIKRPSPDIVKLITKTLKNNKVVVIPTDTAYALAANVYNKKAVKKVFVVKNRSKAKPLSVIVRDLKMAKKIAYPDKKAENLFKKFLPGPLTVILPKKKVISDIATARQKSIGIRIPDCKIIKNLMEKMNFPITATSANVSGKPTPYSVKEILKQYKNRNKKPDLIVDAGRLSKIEPSTIIDLTTEKPRILRKGPIKKEKLLNFFSS